VLGQATAAHLIPAPSVFGLPDRTWLDEVGAPVSVQKELMRHSTISMTMDGYERGVASANRDANTRLVGRLLAETNGQGSEQSVPGGASR